MSTACVDGTVIGCCAFLPRPAGLCHATTTSTANMYYRLVRLLVCDSMNAYKLSLLNKTMFKFGMVVPILVHTWQW